VQEGRTLITNGPFAETKETLGGNLRFALNADRGAPTSRSTSRVVHSWCGGSGISFGLGIVQVDECAYDAQQPQRCAANARDQ
jgi:hypothetical protein